LLRNKPTAAENIHQLNFTNLVLTNLLVLLITGAISFYWLTVSTCCAPGWNPGGGNISWLFGLPTAAESDRLRSNTCASAVPQVGDASGGAHEFMSGLTDELETPSAAKKLIKE